MGTIILLIINFKNIKYSIIYFLLHIFIDIFIDQLKKKIGIKQNKIYIIHQVLHIITIYIIGEILIPEDLKFALNISEDFLKWTLLLIIILKPININFKIVFQKYAPEESNDDKFTIEGAGAMIGNLERLLIAILIYYNQFGAIGLVFTAKSVARFDKISKDPIFAEYYLIGSLYSILSVLIFYGVIFG